MRDHALCACVPGAVSVYCALGVVRDVSCVGAVSPQIDTLCRTAACSDFERVFEIGPVFRAENSNTHRAYARFDLI